MALGNILQMIAQPNAGDMSGALGQGLQQGSQTHSNFQLSNLLKQQASQDEQRFTEVTDQNLLSSLADDFNTALSLGSGESQTQILKSILTKAPAGSSLQVVANDILSTPDQKLQQQKIKDTVTLATQKGLLKPAPKAEKTAEQIASGVDVEQRRVAVEERKAKVAEQKLLKDDTGKTLKLDQLINRRNSLEEGSPDKEIYDAAIKKEVSLPGQAKQRPFISQLMAEGYMPATRITGPMLDALEAAASKADEMGKPLSVQDIQQMEFNAVKNRKTGSTAGGRLTLARKQGIESAQGLLKDMKVTSDKLAYSDVKFIGALQKSKKGQLNDPVFTEYMTQRADSLFVLGNVLKQNGLTDKSIEVEEEAFNPTLAPKAFNAWLNTQVRALNRAAEEMNKDYGFGIKQLPSFKAGQGGAPTEEQPVPTMEGHDNDPLGIR